MGNHQEISSFIWGICDDSLRGLFKQHEYGDVILPLVVLRRLDCVLEPYKKEIVEIHNQFKDKRDDTSKIIHTKLGIKFSNYSQYDFERLKQEPNKLDENIYEYLSSFSSNVQDIIQNFGLQKHIEKLNSNDRLYLLIEKFTTVDLHPDVVDNHTMGQVFEELLRRFSEMSNETSGEHYTPRDVVQLLVSLVFTPDIEELSKPNKIVSVYDPCCGTGGMLTIGKDHILKTISPDVSVNLFGQELNPQTYSICKSDFLITDEEPDNIKLGSTLTKDQHDSHGRSFDYMITNPPFGVSWKNEEKMIKNESKEIGSRFEVGTPRVSDGSLLFLQHMLSKRDRNNGSRIGVVFNGSPLFTGDSGSGESEIRKWIIENDWLECVISLPTKLFFNTGIQTYLWIVTNKKSSNRKGKVQLIDGSRFGTSMRKNLGEKSNYITDEDSQKIINIYQGFVENEYSKIFDNEFFGYTKVTIEQPLKENGIIQLDRKGNRKPDSKLRDYERIPLSENIQDYFEREVFPNLPESWIDRSKDKVGYEINFTKYFYCYTPLRSSTEITKDLQLLEDEFRSLINQIID